MIIIIEGPDGSGKTTLANKIHDQTGYTIYHMDKPKTEEDKLLMLGEYLQFIRTNKNAILDRGWYSEIVYGTVMRDTPAISYPKMYELERKAANGGGAMLIYCTGSKTELWKRCSSRGEDYVKSKEDFDNICDLYDGVMGMPHYIPKVEYRVDVR